MPKDSSFHEYVMADLFKDISGITSRSMFGGYGYYKDGLIFAIIADGELYFKVDDGNRADYEQAGSHPFVYEMGNHKSTTMSYWLLPEDVMEDKDKLRQWIDKAVEASIRSKKKKA